MKLTEESRKLIAEINRKDYADRLARATKAAMDAADRRDAARKQAEKERNNDRA